MYVYPWRVTDPTETKSAVEVDLSPRQRMNRFRKAAALSEACVSCQAKKDHIDSVQLMLSVCGFFFFFLKAIEQPVSLLASLFVRNQGVHLKET